MYVLHLMYMQTQTNIRGKPNSVGYQNICRGQKNLNGIESNRYMYIVYMYMYMHTVCTLLIL